MSFMYKDYAPMNADFINIVEGSYKPSGINRYNNKAYNFWQRQLIQRLQSVIELQVPEEWNGNTKDFLFYCLFRWGYVGVSYSNKFGLFFQPCTLNGQNFYYQPTHICISNPQLETELEIGTECELLRLTPDYMGCWDIISYYAEKLAILDPAINIAEVNAKFAFFLGVKNKQSGEVFKKAMDKINSGEPMVVFDKKLSNDATDKSEPWQFWTREDMGGQYILDKLLRDFQTIINEFDNEVGIPTVPYQKAERMVTSEADSKELDATSKCTVWVDCLNSSIERIKKLYPDIKLSAKLRFSPKDGGVKDGECENNAIRNDGV